MFKLESYITPIILNHVAKYVKNIRPEDAQVSLWEGEVSFQNLDMRLDVLESELNLPFEILSGHIHELSIRVPWTKITSEPIRITINTIEFILKLRNSSTESSGSPTSLSSPKRRSTRARSSRPEVLPQQQPIGAGLVNKIINNIMIECHNIILKYVEEDIVVSMNVQLLSFGAADEKWNHAMVDIHPVKVLMRRLMKISDLTICLDKRNAAGQIDVCQEPIMYRCTLECRILQKYNVNNPSGNRTTRVGIFTKAMEINISSLQFPMAMRLLHLIMVLSSGDFEAPPNADNVNEDEFEEAESDGSTVSYLTWAWNMIPSFSFETTEEDDQTGSSEVPSHTIDIGFYIEELNFTLKNSEYITDTLMGGAKRIRYTPIMRISLGGIYLESVTSEERAWTNLKAGVSLVAIEPLGAYRVDEMNNNNIIIETSTIPTKRSFIDKSLFDEQCLIADKGWGVTSFDEYTARITDEYLIYRSPVFAFDLVSYRLTSPDNNDEVMTTATSSSECKSNMSKQCRLLSGGVTFRYNQPFMQVKNIIIDYVDSYDYPAYHTDRNDAASSGSTAAKLHPPIMEDYDALVRYIPLCIYKIDFRKIKIEVHGQSEPNQIKKPYKRMPSVLKQTLPYFVISCDHIEGTMSTPLDPDKLVHTTCQLPDKPSELLNACYNNFRIDVHNFNISLQNLPHIMCANIMQIPNMEMSYGKLLQPHLWNNDLSVEKFDLICNNCNVEFSKYELATSKRLLHCVGTYHPYTIWALANPTNFKNSNDSNTKLYSKFNNLNVKMRTYKDFIIWNGFLQSVSSELVLKHETEVVRHSVLSTSAKKHNNNTKWLEIQAQLPREKGNKNINTAMGIWIEPINVTLDATIVKLFEYEDVAEYNLEKDSTLEVELLTQTLNTTTNAALMVNTALTHSSGIPPLGRRSSRTTFSNTRKQSHPEETIHLSSDREERQAISIASKSMSIVPEQYLEYLKYFERLILHFELAQCKLIIAKDFTTETVTNNDDHIEIMLPKIILKSTNSNYIARSNIRQQINIPDKNRTIYNWTIELNEFAINHCKGKDRQNILIPVHTTITIAMNHKRETVKVLSSSVVEMQQSEKAPVKNDVPNETDESVNELNIRVASPTSVETVIPSEQEKIPETATSSNLTMLKTLIDAISLNIHADTTRLKFLLSPQKVKTIQQNFNTIYSLTQILQQGSDSSMALKAKTIVPIKIVTSSEENASIKEFLDLETTSAASSQSTDKPLSNLTLSLFCQWTIARIIMELESDVHQKDNKIMVELEDLLFSFDKRIDFTKITSKMGQFHLNYLKMNTKGEWKPTESLRIKMLGESASAPFLSVIVTSVNLKDLYKKIGANRKAKINRGISEILIKMQAIEMIVDLDEVTEFFAPLCFLYVLPDDSENPNTKTTKAAQPLVVEDLPLIHLDSKGFALYLPMETTRKSCSACIFKIEDIKITSNLENPLQRNPIRSDVFSKAAQLGILGTPGSFVEDRQYELILRNISAASGNWNELLSFMREQTNNFLRTNPAFEWNNQQRRTALQLTDFFNNFTFSAIYAPHIVLNNVLICGQAIEFNCTTDFVATLNTNQLSLISCILTRVESLSEVISNICMNSDKCQTKKTIKIESSALRQSVSCSTIDAYFTPSVCSYESKDLVVPDIQNSSSLKRFEEQNRNETCSKCCKRVNLRDSIRDKIIAPVLIDQIRCNCLPMARSQSLGLKKSCSDTPIHGNTLESRRKQQTSETRNPPIFKSIDETTECDISKPDSGIQSSISNIRSGVHNTERFASISSAASVLQDRYDYTQSLVRQLPYTISLVAGIFVIKIFHLKENDKETIKMPLLSFTISQPSFMITQNVFDAVTQMSLFDLLLDLSISSGGDEKVAPLFPIKIINTRPGETNASGIPTPLFTLKAHRTKMNLLEVDIDVARSISIVLEEKHVHNLYKYILLIYESIIDNPCFNMRSTTPVVRATKIQLLHRQFFNADRLVFNCHKILIQFTDKNKYNIKVISTDLKLNVKFLTRPEKASINLILGSLHIQTEQKIFLHPASIRISTDLVSEPWNKLPLVTVMVKFNMIQIDMGIYGLMQLRNAAEGFKRIQVLTNEEWRQLLEKRPSEMIDWQPDKLSPIKCPAVKNYDELKKSTSKSNIEREEFYQDDLRAGAFQFVELTTDSFLPLPYQIQIIKKNYGTICWRYPQPRKMCKIQIFPVPMPSDHPLHIKCRMEYFSEVHECFMFYCDFELSESNSRDITLPEREICANIWRVVIIQSYVHIDGGCFDVNEEDEELRSIPNYKFDSITNEHNGSDFILHPKVLVCCMRIDTSFKSKSVPKIQVLISCNHIELKFLNQPNENEELPTILKKFRLVSTSPMSQTFLIMLAQNINIHASFYGLQNYILENNLTFRIKCIDYGFLNLLDLLEETNIQSYFLIDKSKRRFVSNIVLDKLHINFGPTILHSLLSSKQHWEELLKVEDPKQRHCLVPKCIVVNRTCSRVLFGQTGTIERIQLMAKECHLYSFCSDFHNQELTFFITDDKLQITEASQSVPITFKFEGKNMLQPIRIGNKCLIIKSYKLSSTQIFILIKGQIELVSMVPNDLSIEIRNDAKQDDRKLLEHMIEQNGRVCFYAPVEMKSNVFMRIKFANQLRGRTGDIPLKPNKNLPWLVKVPIENNDFVSFWVRVLRENITELHSSSFKPQKVLIIIWPIFIINSMLSRLLHCEDDKTKIPFDIKPAGGRQILSLPATHLTDHRINFKYPFPITSNTPTDYNITLKHIDWQQFFAYDEKLWTIEYALYALGKPTKVQWPLADDEESRIARISYTSHKARIVYKCVPGPEFSCTQHLEIFSWGLFINGTDVEVIISEIVGNEEERTDIIAVKPNCVEMMATINQAFTISIPNGSGWVESLPIYIKDTYTDNDCNRNIKSYVVTSATHCDIVILRSDSIFKFILDLRIENERRIFRLRPKYIVTNFTKNNLCMLPFAMDHKECSSRDDVVALDTRVHKNDLTPADSMEKCIGHVTDGFYDLSSCKTKRTIDTAFAYFVCFKQCEDSDISIPIPLTMPFTRRCFSIQMGQESIALVATLIEKDDIYYLNVFEDISPAILVHNHTDVSFLIAQTNANENCNVTRITPEYEGRSFDWYQMLPAYCKTYYTPPEMYSNFPDIESTVCNLTLAVVSEKPTKKTIKWSKPIRTDKSWEKFLHVPNRGDVKIIVCDKHRIVRVSIYYISENVEFSVKDLRTRLLTPHLTHESSQDSDESLTTIHPMQSEASLTEVQISPKCIHFSNDSPTKQEMNVRFFIKETVFNLYTDSKDRDYMKNEIFRMHIDDLIVAYDDEDDNHQLNIVIPNLQIDNQLYSTGKFDFPVILCSEELYNRHETLPQVHYLDQMYHELRNMKPMAIFTLKFFDEDFQINSFVCKLSPMRAYIEDAYVNEFLEALVECDPTNCIHKPKKPTEKVVLSEGTALLPNDIVAQAVCIAEPLRLGSFRIEPLNLMLSVHTSVRMYIALDHSPLSFSAYHRQQVLTVPLRLGQSLGMHYLSGAIFGAGWVVGSLEILGSPSGLARSFTTGLRDFVSMPVEGLFRGPWGFIVGVTQGSASLLRNVTAGTVNSVTKLASSVARNLDRLSLDSEHIERCEALRRSRPQGFAEGFTQGITSLGISILGAVGGLAHHTLEARTPVEVVTGVGKGLVGALTKPLSGAAELVALAGQGVLHTVGFNALPQQRMPSICRNMAIEPSAYRIWKLLPGVLATDQVLFYHEVTLVIQSQMRRGYIFLTSAVFALLEVQWSKLSFVCPINKVLLICDQDDKNLMYVHTTEENEDIEEYFNYTKQRIMHFLYSSHSIQGIHDLTADSLNDMLQRRSTLEVTRMDSDIDFSFYINENMGQHLLQYLKLMQQK